MAVGYTLVPKEIFSEGKAREILSEVVPLDKEEPLSFLELPTHPIYLIYSGDERPVVYDMILSLVKIRDFNKIILCRNGNSLNVVVACGGTLALCNRFKAADIETVLYYVCLALKRLQINPQLSVVYFMSAVPENDARLFLRYFKGVEVLR